MRSRLKKLEKKMRRKKEGILIYRQGPDGEKLDVSGEALDKYKIEAAALLLEWDSDIDGI